MTANDIPSEQSTPNNESAKEPSRLVDNSDLYPERKGEKYKHSWASRVFSFAQSDDIDKIKCETRVYDCITKSPLVKLMQAALKSSGCELDIRRHISCEVCDTSVTGGYDPELNQIVICQNSANSKGLIQGILSHEMIHMFDFCRNNLDLSNLDHLACTEIRAANLCHCSFVSAWIQGIASPFNIKERHQICVKEKAMQSVIAARKVSEDVARAAVLRVFDKCYNDLEPIGRRIRRNSMHMKQAYLEAPLYGYVD